ncbi:hypothetical protein F5Y08DRAFT_344152 [Xylaria arbuscula]|nr:hypothetical protein F5Y08DRAFT_344152 [Xylaria arbuscula]
MAYEKYYGTSNGQDTGYGGSNGYQAYEGSGHASSYATSSRSPSKGCGGVQEDKSKWRWNCCGCGFQNLSYTYEPSCSSCAHRRDTNCKVWAVA